MSSAILVGNPKARSRTYEAARLVARRLTGREPDEQIDLAGIAPALLDWSDPTAKEVIATIQGVDLVVVASPTYKGTYTGVLKLLFDRAEAGAFDGVTAIPLMLGGDWRHSLAPEVFLKPVLAELGFSCPTRGLFLLDSEYANPDGLTAWLRSAAAQLGAPSASD